jgi:23S rRNA (uridine2552-2'-O)-methyltransferase
MVNSKQWLQRHVKDPYVQQAKIDGYRSRAVYKLLEINDKENILRQGMGVIDLGAAPGSWSEVAINKVGHKGFVIALDILPMDPINDVVFLEGDFREEQVLGTLLDLINSRPIDLIISDMAPNLSGHKSVDQPRSVYLVELALDLATKVLSPNGALLVKMFQGSGIEEFVKQLRLSFKQVKHIKPKASRLSSKEVYVLAKGFK